MFIVFLSFGFVVLLSSHTKAGVMPSPKTSIFHRFLRNQQTFRFENGATMAQFAVTYVRNMCH
jgi:hypothetical protein